MPEYTTIPCRHCQRPFCLKSSAYAFKQTQGQTLFFCTRPCAVRYHARVRRQASVHRLPPSVPEESPHAR